VNPSSKYDYWYNPLLLGNAPNLESNKTYLDDTQSANGAIYAVVAKGTSNRYPLFVNKRTNAVVGGKYHVLCSEQELSDIHQVIVQHAQPLGYADTQASVYMATPNPILTSLYNGVAHAYWANAYEDGSRQARERRRADQLRQRYAL
jgi:hypothetical protein